jgi:protein TonB
MSPGIADPLLQLTATSEGRVSISDRLAAMLFFAALLHAIILLGITFTMPDDHGDSAPGMEVLLVTRDIPESLHNDNATYLAQRTQKGSGNTKRDMTETPSTVAAAPLPGPESPQSTERQQAAGDAVLTNSASRADIRYYPGRASRAESAALAASEQAPRYGRGPGDELVLRGVLRADLWLSPDTRASTLAPYLDRWRRKVERVGTLNYPLAAQRAGLSGSPVIEVVIRADGRLDKATIQRSSGLVELDQAALGILRLASPFDPFPSELTAEHRSLRFSYQWEFSDGRLGRGAVRQGGQPGRSP